MEWAGRREWSQWCVTPKTKLKWGEGRGAQRITGCISFGWMMLYALGEGSLITLFVCTFSLQNYRSSWSKNLGSWLRLECIRLFSYPAVGACNPRLPCLLRHISQYSLLIPSLMTSIFNHAIVINIPLLGSLKMDQFMD